MSEEEKKEHIVEYINLENIKAYLSLKDWSNREYFNLLSEFVRSAQAEGKFSQLNSIEIEEQKINNESHMVFFIKNKTRDEKYVTELKDDIKKLCQMMAQYPLQFKSASYYTNKEFIQQILYKENLEKSLVTHARHSQRKI